MTDSKAETKKTGGRLPLLKTSELNLAQKALRETMSGMLAWAAKSGFAAETEDGELLGPFNAFLYSPEIATGQFAYQLAEAKSTSLSKQIREVVILTVGAVWGAAYEEYAHRVVGKKVGISPADLDLLAAGKPPAELGAEAIVAQRFTYTLTKDRRVPDDLYAEAMSAFGAKGVVDMIHLASLYMMVSSILNVFEVPVPE